ARVVDHPLDAVALAHQAPVELAHVVQACAAEGHLLDEARLLTCGPAAHQRDLVVGGLCIRAQEHHARAPVLLGDLQAEEVAIERDHALQIAHEDADVAESGNFGHRNLLWNAGPVICSPEDTMRNPYRAAAMTVLLAFAGAAFAQSPDNTVGPSTGKGAADGSRPADGAIKGGAIVPGESGGTPDAGKAPNTRSER